jgi:hypothetical protein
MSVKVGTPEAVRLSYAFIGHPRKADDKNKKEKYGALLMIPKENKATLKALNDTIAQVFAENPSFFKGYKLTSINPIRDGAGESTTGKQYDPLYADYYLLNVSSTQQPKCLDKESKEILDVEEEIYSGVWAKCGLVLAPYKAPEGGKVGIGVYLNLVKKMKDDVRLAGEVKEEDYWDGEGKEEDDPLL